MRVSSMGRSRGRRALAVTVLAGAAGLAADRAALAADDLPRWSLAEACARESDPGTCRLFEAEARRTVSGAWLVLPDAIRRQCSAAATAYGQGSYRLLALCLEDEHAKRNAAHAKAVGQAGSGTPTTAATPAAQPQAPAPSSDAPPAAPGVPAEKQ